MNTQNFDIEQMREAWVEMGKALGMSSIPDNNPKDFQKKKTSLDHLRERYRNFWIFSLIMAFAGFLIFSTGRFIMSNLNLWLGIAYAVYFLTTSLMDYWLWKGLGTIDPLQMSVSEIAGKAMFYRKRHLQFMIILIPMAIALLCFTGYVFSSEMYFLNGMIAGAILGLILGTIQFRRFMSEYRKLSD